MANSWFTFNFDVILEISSAICISVPNLRGRNCKTPRSQQACSENNVTYFVIVSGEHASLNDTAEISF